VQATAPWRFKGDRGQGPSPTQISNTTPNVATPPVVQVEYMSETKSFGHEERVEEISAMVC